MSASGIDVLVIGSANMDLLMRVQALPATGETVLGGDATVSSGGKGANQAVAAALAGARVAIAGRVGGDAYGEDVCEALAGAGVDVGRLTRTAGARTGLAVVVVDAKGDNTIVVAPGANHAVTPDDVEGLRDDIAAAGLVLMQLELPVGIVARAAEIAADEGTPVLLNVAPVAALPPSLLQAVDILVLNRQEAASLAGRDLGDVAGLRGAACELRARGPSTVVITAGGDGAVVGDADGALHVPAIPVEVVDTAGAGVAFVGVLAAGVSRGIVVREALGPAMAAGAAAVGLTGARLTELPSRLEPGALGRS